MLDDSWKNGGVEHLGYRSWLRFISRVEKLSADEGIPYKDVLHKYSPQELYRKGFEAGVRYFITKEVDDDQV